MDYLNHQVYALTPLTRIIDWSDQECLIDEDHKNIATTSLLTAILCYNASTLLSIIGNMCIDTKYTKDPSQRNGNL